MGKSRKPSVSAARPVQAGGRIHAKATDGRILAKPAEAHARFGAGLADDGIRPGAKPAGGSIRLGAKPGAGCVRLGKRPAEGYIRLGKEVAANFRAWFERNFVNRRAGRIGRASYARAGMFDDRPGDGMWYAEALDRAWTDYRSGCKQRQDKDERYIRGKKIRG